MIKIFVGDVGTEIMLDCGQDIAAATKAEIHVIRPDGVRLVWGSSIDSATRIRYVTQLGDLSLPGDWFIQGYLEMLNWKGRTSFALLTVCR